ncbi:GTPase [Candidatus Micrarchaeota archaeon]|nr:GTPase [Candidatus Micrarchaeota archaeon]
MAGKGNRRRALIMGAAGRDFHNFNSFFRNNKEYEVVCFTAAQIPGIAGRKYPPCLAGRLYPKGIPIYPEEKLESLINSKRIDEVFFSYSDVSHEYVMHMACRAMAAGASFSLLGPNDTCIKSKKPVFAICATRTGAGKSPLSKLISKKLVEKGARLAVIRHPMPYGDLKAQAVQRFSRLEDLDKYKCTIEEREEYEGHMRNGAILFAGVDYHRIIKEAEKEADIIMWDGGNNDYPFFFPDFHVCVADALRPTHASTYYPGEVNFRMADLILISKHSQNPRGARQLQELARELNPKANILKANIEVSRPRGIKGKKVLIVEDGPTLTHGGMEYGAGLLAARRAGAKPINPQKYAEGSLKKVFAAYPHLREVLPAMGYGKKQVAELQNSINNSPAEIVVSGTPISLSSLIKTNKRIVDVSYSYPEKSVEAILKRIYSMC